MSRPLASAGQARLRPLRYAKAYYRFSGFGSQSRLAGERASDTVVFVPAWNEEDNLAAVLDELHRELPEADVVVVDDGSTDGTVAVAKEHSAEVFSFPRTGAYGQRCGRLRVCR